MGFATKLQHLRKVKLQEAMERFQKRHGHNRMDEVDDEFANLECWQHSGYFVTHMFPPICYFRIAWLGQCNSMLVKVVLGTNRFCLDAQAQLAAGSSNWSLLV